MSKKLIISFLLVFLLSNMTMFRVQIKLLDSLEARHPKSGFINPYLAKEFEKEKIHRSVQNDEGKSN